MIRRHAIGRSPRRSTGPRWFRPRLESLEDRRLLAFDDLLVAHFGATNFQVVTRYDSTLHNPAAGGVFQSQDEPAATGIAAAPDGSFWVSYFSGQVRHYSNSGAFLGQLGQNDAAPAFMGLPGTLTFGPNGHLYVADLGASFVDPELGQIDIPPAIHQFDTSSATQQYLAASSLYLDASPGGVTFAANGDLIVGGFTNGPITQYHGNTPTVLVPGGQGVNPSSLVRLPDGDLLVSDMSLDDNPGAHHRIGRYDLQSNTFNANYITVTQPTAGTPPHAATVTSLLLDRDGTVLAGVSPDSSSAPSTNGAIQRYNPSNPDTGVLMETIITSLGIPSALALMTPSTVSQRKLFYDHSSYDDPDGAGVLSGAGFNAALDNLAVDPNKVPLFLPGTANFNNVTGWIRGVNGIMFDLQKGVNHSGLTAADFTFRVGNDQTPSGWASPAALTTHVTVHVIPGGGAAGNDRVELIWNDDAMGADAIKNKWLQVTVKTTNNTGLAKPDVFYFGSKLGAVGPSNGSLGDGDIGGFLTTGADVAGIRVQIAAAPVVTAGNNYDLNKDGLILGGDIAANRIGIAADGAAALVLLTIGAPLAPPPAPAAPQANFAGDAAPALLLVVASDAALPSDGEFAQALDAARTTVVVSAGNAAAAIWLPKLDAAVSESRAQFFAALAAAESQAEPASVEIDPPHEELDDELLAALLAD